MGDTKTTPDILSSIGEQDRQIRNLRSTIAGIFSGDQTLLNVIWTWAGTGMVKLIGSAILKLMDNAYLVYDDGSSERIRIGHQADGSISIKLTACDVVMTGNSLTISGGTTGDVSVSVPGRVRAYALRAGPNSDFQIAFSAGRVDITTV